jgi:hypothetical protein
MPPRKKTLQTPSILAAIEFATAVRATDQSAEALIKAIINAPDPSAVISTDSSDIEGFVKAIAEVAAFPQEFTLSQHAIQVLLDLIDYAKQDETTGALVAKVASSPILEELLTSHLKDAVQSANATPVLGDDSLQLEITEIDNATEDDEDEPEAPVEVPVIPLMDGVTTVSSNLL